MSLSRDSDKLTARRIYCIGSRCLGRVLGEWSVRWARQARIRWRRRREGKYARDNRRRWRYRHSRIRKRKLPGGKLLAIA